MKIPLHHVSGWSLHEIQAINLRAIQRKWTNMTNSYEIIGWQDYRLYTCAMYRSLPDAFIAAQVFRVKLCASERILSTCRTMDNWLLGWILENSLKLNNFNDEGDEHVVYALNEILFNLRISCKFPIFNTLSQQRIIQVKLSNEIEHSLKIKWFVRLVATIEDVSWITKILLILCRQPIGTYRIPREFPNISN